MIGHRFMGISLVFTGDIAQGRAHSITRSRFMILPSIVRWRHDLARHPSGNPCPVGRWLCGFLAIPRPRSQTQGAQGCARDRSSRHFDVALSWHVVDPISSAEITRQQTRFSMNLPHLADEKDAAYLEGVRNVHQGCLLVLTGKAADAVQMITSGHRRMAVNGSNKILCRCIYHIWREPMRNLANSMTLGAVLAKP